MRDMIIQTIEEYQRALEERDEEIRRLKFELSKWTDRQKGRRQKVTEEMKKIIKAMKAEGKSNRAIGREIGVSEKTIRRHLPFLIGTE